VNSDEADDHLSSSPPMITKEVVEMVARLNAYSARVMTDANKKNKKAKR
jgi:hypothetical protein